MTLLRFATEIMHVCVSCSIDYFLLRWYWLGLIANNSVFQRLSRNSLSWLELGGNWVSISISSVTFYRLPFLSFLHCDELNDHLRVAPRWSSVRISAYKGSHQTPAVGSSRSKELQINSCDPVRYQTQLVARRSVDHVWRGKLFHLHSHSNAHTKWIRKIIINSSSDQTDPRLFLLLPEI